MTPSEALAVLDGYTNLGVVPGLERMRVAMSLLGDPQHCAPVVHVTGTNGKTSVARIVSTVLGAHGLATGLYTSPHLADVYERIELSGKAIDPQVFSDTVEHLLPIADEVERLTKRRPTYFELSTMAAFVAMANAAVDVMVIEVGMGGRYDATNVANGTVTVLTNVSVDHEAFLGTDIAEICREKAGIVKAGSRVVTGITDPGLLGVIEGCCADAEAEVPLVALGADLRLDRVDNAHGGIIVDMTTRHLTYKDMFVPLLGCHQGLNVALGIAAVEEFFGRGLDSETLESALRSVVVPGRLEVVGRRPLVVLDGAHNPDGAVALARAVKETFCYDRLIWVAGVLGDKDIRGIVPPLACLASTVIVTAATETGCEPQWLADVVRDCGGHAVVVAGPQAALAHAHELARADDLILVAGSLYLVGALRPSGPPA